MAVGAIDVVGEMSSKEVRRSETVCNCAQY